MFAWIGDSRNFLNVCLLECLIVGCLTMVAWDVYLMSSIMECLLACACAFRCGDCGAD